MDDILSTKADAQVMIQSGSKFKVWASATLQNLDASFTTAGLLSYMSLARSWPDANVVNQALDPDLTISRAFGWIPAHTGPGLRQWLVDGAWTLGAPHPLAGERTSAPLLDIQCTSRGQGCHARVGWSASGC